MRRTSPLPSRLLAWILIVGWLPTLAAAGQPPSASLEPVERPAEDVLVVDLKLGRLVLYEALLAYSAEQGRVLLPLGQTAAALDFAITVDPAAGQAEGWFLAENRRFDLDAARGRVTVEGRPAPYRPAGVEAHRDDIYVDTRLLERWWPVDFEVDFSRLEVVLRGREKLPVERRRERQERRRGLLTEGPLSGPRFPPRPLPYRALSWPLLDARLQATFRQGEGGEGGGGVVVDSRQDLLLTGEIARLSAELFFSGVEGPVGDSERRLARLRLGRRDPQGGLLGPLGARELFIGDLLTPARPLVSRSTGARGVSISSFPLDAQRQLHQTDLRGEALPGFEVELYRNDELLAFQEVGAEGRYAFEKIPLVEGLNLLRLVFYGPHEERREVVERIFIQPGSRPATGVHYRVGVFQQDRSLFRQQTGGSRRDDGLRRDGPPGDLRLFFELGAPMGRWGRLRAGWQSLTLEDGEHHYPSLQLASRLGPVFALLDATTDVSAGGWAGRALVQTRWRGVDLLFEETRLGDFDSEEIRGGDGAPRRRTSLRAQGRLGAKGLRFSLEGFREASRAGERTTQWRGRISAPRGVLSTSLGLDGERRRGFDGSRRERLDAQILMSGTWRRLNVRGLVGYRLEPASRLAQVSVSAGWQLGRHSGLSFDWTRSSSAVAGGSTSSLYGLGWSRRFSGADFGANLALEPNGGLAAGLSLSFGMGKSPLSPRWRSQWRPTARRGVVAARVFLDRDGDGRWSEGDRPLPGVAVTRDGFAAGVETDARGVAWLSNLAPYRHVDLGIETGSLEDPYWLPVRAGVGLVPRPGRVARVEMPVVVTGEIDGMVVLERNGAETGMARVDLELLDAAGEVVRRVQTAYDGFYLFEGLTPGAYRVRVAPRQLERLRLEASPAVREAAIAGEGTVLSGLDFRLVQ